MIPLTRKLSPSSPNALLTSHGFRDTRDTVISVELGRLSPRYTYRLLSPRMTDSMHYQRLVELTYSIPHHSLRIIYRYSFLFDKLKNKRLDCGYN